MRGKQATINLLKSLLDYESNTKWGKALQYAVSQVEKSIDNDITEKEIDELVESFVEVEYVCYGQPIYCIMDSETERLSKELFSLVSGTNGAV